MVVSVWGVYEKRKQSKYIHNHRLHNHSIHHHSIQHTPITAHTITALSTQHTYVFTGGSVLRGLLFSLHVFNLLFLLHHQLTCLCQGGYVDMVCRGVYM